MIAPNYMHISGYPLAYTKSSNGTVSGELIHIESYEDMDEVKRQFAGNLEGKVRSVRYCGQAHTLEVLAAQGKAVCSSVRLK